MTKELIGIYQIQTQAANVRILIMERRAELEMAANITRSIQRTVGNPPSKAASGGMMTMILLQRKCAVPVEEDPLLVRFQIFHKIRIKWL